MQTLSQEAPELAASSREGLREAHLVSPALPVSTVTERASVEKYPGGECRGRFRSWKGKEKEDKILAEGFSIGRGWSSQ